MASYTSADDLEIDVVSTRYSLHRVTIVPLAGGAANSSFHLTADEGEFVLTILDNHDEASAVQLAAYTQQLYSRGIPTTEVVPDRGGNAVSVVGGRPVLLKRWIDGDILDPLPTHLLSASGCVLARLHDLPATMHDLPVGTRRLSPEHKALITGFEDAAFAAWLTEQLGLIEQQESSHHRERVICHGDLFADNLIHRADDSLAIIDWETVSLDDPLLDLGMAAVGLAQHDGHMPLNRLQQLVHGYTKFRALSSQDLEQLRIEIIHAAVIIAFHRYYRHNVRFPDPGKSTIHREIIKFVESLPPATTMLSALHDVSGECRSSLLGSSRESSRSRG